MEEMVAKGMLMDLVVVILVLKLSKFFKKKGKVRSIGVSNCSEKMLEQILPTAKIIPAVNQLEIHVYNPQHKLQAYLRSKGILPQAYSPLGSSGSPLLSDDVVTSIAKKIDAQPAHVLVAYPRKH